MPRPAVFSIPTRLWHPTEGWREFPAGEQDPGGAWHEKEGGAPVGAASTEQALRDLIAAQDQIEKLGDLLSRKDHDLAQAEKRAADAVAELEALKQAGRDAEAAKAGAEDAAADLTGERDRALAEATAQRARAEEAQAALEVAQATTERLIGELNAANQRAADKEGRIQELETDLANAKAQVGKFDPDGDGKVGGSRAKAEKPAA